MLFHLIGVEILEIADGSRTLVSTRAFIVICPIAADISVWNKVAGGRTDYNGNVYKSRRWFKASKQPEKRLSSAPEETAVNDNGGVISVFSWKVLLLEVTLSSAGRVSETTTGQHTHTHTHVNY